ncbi:MAG: hypothetical protein ACYYK0_01830 [Candidatus Eutrophobiaceae bacterium]
MRKNRRDFDIFSMSFLDIISCGFAAVVMLILISKPASEISFNGDYNATQIESALDKALSMRTQIESLKKNTDAQKIRTALLDKDLRKALAQEQKLALDLENMEQRSQSQQQGLDKLTETQQALAQIPKTEIHASINTTKKADKRDPNVGGIPVDSEYVIFVVDTSGSMQQVWGTVVAQVSNILNIHPKVSGFQILSDNGASILTGYEGKWIPDTGSMRNRVLKHMKKWTAFSDSNPVDGVETALKKYSPKGASMAVYVFGDEYTGGDYDAVLNAISKTNRNHASGKLRARIHAVGFLGGAAGSVTSLQFSTLMQEMTRLNNGTYIALPR